MKVTEPTLREAARAGAIEVGAGGRGNAMVGLPARDSGLSMAEHVVNGGPLWFTVLGEEEPYSLDLGKIKAGIQMWLESGYMTHAVAGGSINVREIQDHTAVAILQLALFGRFRFAYYSHRRI